MLYLARDTKVGNPFLVLKISPLHSEQAGVKSANPVLSERYGYENRLQGVDLQFVSYTVVACLCAINNVNSRQCTLLLSHSSWCISSQMEVTLEYLLAVWKPFYTGIPEELLHEILAMTFKFILFFSYLA